MSNGMGIMIEALVAILLLVTIGYCMRLNSGLKRLKADEQSLKATISELITATEIAERAIGGLKLTVRECDQGLGQRLRAAEALSCELARQIDTGTQVLGRLAQIAAAARPAEPAAPVLSIAHDVKATAAAAQAFVARTRLRSSGAAA